MVVFVVLFHSRLPSCFPTIFPQRNQFFSPHTLSFCSPFLDRFEVGKTNTHVYVVSDSELRFILTHMSMKIQFVRFSLHSGSDRSEWDEILDRTQHMERDFRAAQSNSL